MTKTAVNDQVNIKITLRHSNNHNNIEEYARDAVQGLVKFFPNIMSCHVILDHQKNDFEKNKLAEITVHVPQNDFVSKEAGIAYEPAIDNCIAALTKQLQKHKDKMQ
ncbi:MAG: ribosome-associated translation inhibitor RaiA [Chlorobium sp.]|nr:MAG: ribosome-associated translation inhibitor RaiA [Chlorobium sp.]